MHGRRHTSRRPEPSIHTQLHTTAEDNIERRRTYEISSDKPSHLITPVQEWYKCTVLFKTMSVIYGRALDATSLAETQRHGTLWTIKQWKRLAHCMLFVRCAAFLDTLSREFLMLIPTGQLEDIWLALRRREQREIKSKVSNLLEAQWCARQRLSARQQENSVEEGTERLRSSTDCDPEARQRCNVLRTMRDVWESVAAHSLDHGGIQRRS